VWANVRHFALREEAMTPFRLLALKVIKFAGIKAE
jgi:hypothetical protein